MNTQSDLRIPYDILTLIIDQLASERNYNELRTCSQTCRILLHPCRVHLFSDVAIDSHNTRKFATLLKKNSTILKYIHKLTIRFNYRDITTADYGDLANAFLLLNDVKIFNIIAGRYYCNWERLPPNLKHAFVHLLRSPSLSTLFLDRITNFPVFLLSSCSTLKHLAMTDCYAFSSKACDQLDIHGAPPQLLSLNLSDNSLLVAGTAMEDLPKMKRASGLPVLDLSSLRSLVVRVDCSRKEKDFEHLLRLSPKLDYLEWSVFQDATSDSWAQKLAIVLPTLRSLKLIWDIYDNHPNIAFPRLIKILKALTYQPNCINELSLFLPVHMFKPSSDGLLSLDWEVLDQALADRSSFPWLERLTIQLQSKFFSDVQMLAEIEGKLEETKSTRFSRLFLAANDYLNFKFEIDR